MGFLKMFSFLDIFSSPVSLSFGKQKKRTSLCGICFSLGIFIFLIYQFSQSDLFALQKPIVVLQTVEQTYFPNIIFDSNHLLTVQVSDRQSKRIIDSSIFNVTFQIFHIKTDESGVSNTLNEEILKLHPCNIQDVAFNPRLFASLGLNNSLCLDQKDFKLAGGWIVGDVRNAVATLKVCVNGTSIICKPKEDIIKFFSEMIFFSANYHSIITDLQ